MSVTENLIPVLDRLGALSEALRLRILRLIEQHELSVGEIASTLQVPQSTVSRHLKVLGSAGWIDKRSMGTATFYSLILDDLPQEARNLWGAVRAQLSPDDPVYAEDVRRVAAVLDARKTDSRTFFGRVAGEWDDLRQRLFGEHFTALGMLALMNPEWSVADFGCGTGNASELIAPYVGKVLAIDQSQPMLDAARKRLKGVNNVELIEGEIEGCPLQDDVVDASLLILVLHHLENPERAIREMARVTKPGGVVLVVDMHEHGRREFRRDMGHRHLGFTPEQIEQAFSDAGLDRPRIRTLPGPRDAKGPGLFVATSIVS